MQHLCQETQWSWPALQHARRSWPRFLLYRWNPERYDAAPGACERGR